MPDAQIIAIGRKLTFRPCLDDGLYRRLVVNFGAVENVALLALRGERVAHKALVCHEKAAKRIAVSVMCIAHAKPPAIINRPTRPAHRTVADIKSRIMVFLLWWDCDSLVIQPEGWTARMSCVNQFVIHAEVINIQGWISARHLCIGIRNGCCVNLSAAGVKSGLALCVIHIKHGVFGVSFKRVQDFKCGHVGFSCGGVGAGLKPCAMIKSG
jgi:hypothetical protein